MRAVVSTRTLESGPRRGGPGAVVSARTLGAVVSARTLGVVVNARTLGAVVSARTLGAVVSARTLGAARECAVGSCSAVRCGELR
jgi:hypothetical protein